MIRHLYVWGSWADLVFLAGGVTLGQNAPAETPARTLASSPARQLVTLAVIASVDNTLGQNEQPGGQNCENMEDLLTMELAGEWNRARRIRCP